MVDVIDVQPQTPTTEIVKPMEADLAKLTPEQIDERVGAIERAAEAKQRMIRAALRILYPQDWIKFGDKPYLTGSGAMRLCGIGINLSKPDFEIVYQGDDIFVTCCIEAEWPAMGQRSVQLGSCNTRDKFFNADGAGSVINQCRKNSEGNERLARKMMLGHVQKKAQENAVSRAVCAVMGVKDLTWDDLEKAGFSRDKAGADIQFKKGSTVASRKEGAEQSPSCAMADVIGQAVGSIVTTSGNISSVMEKKKKDGETYFRIGFETGPIATYWKSEIDDWVRGGQAVIATIKVGKYGDGKSYQIEHLELDEVSDEPS